jgi:hypothetical protein
VLIMMLFVLEKFEEASMDTRSFHGIFTFWPSPEFLVLVAGPET